MDIDKLMKDAESRFDQIKKQVEILSANLTEAQAEMTRIQGEYRLLAKLQAEAKGKPSPDVLEKA